MKIPSCVEVRKLISSRYPDNQRPASWDSRVGGTDIVETVDGERLSLKSDGMQTPPQAGWVLLLTDGTDESGYSWTVYGMKKYSA